MARPLSTTLRLPLSLLLLLLLPAPVPCQATPRVVCFYEDWARYRSPLARFLPANIPPHLCTHIHYVGANVDEETLHLGPLDGFADIIGGGYRDTVALRRHNPQLRVLVMIGTSSETQQQALSSAAATPESRKQLAAEVVLFLREHQLDGLDLDWKPPHAPDTHAALLEALRAAFDGEQLTDGRRRLLLSAELSADPAELRANFDIARITASVDYAGVLGYTYHSTEADETYHHAPLRTPPGAPARLAGRDFMSTLAALQQMGADPSKLNLAVATFGQTFELRSAGRNGLYAPTAGAGAKGPLTLSAGSLATYEICDMTGRRGWTPVRPFPEALGPFASSGNQWVAYDDEAMLRRKGWLARASGLGGVAVWTITQDDFRGFCTGTPFPMIRALKAGIFGVKEAQLPTTPAPPTTPAYDATDIFICPGNGKYAAHNCSQFYFCRGGEADLLNCEAGETYDNGLRACRPGGRCNPPPALQVNGFGPTPTPAPAGRPAPPARPVSAAWRPRIYGRYR
ncbi:chitinase-3-like protein 1 [Pollicipes pollicipes]|uniref:chitinase-3-like protein 1 n=1 Tax=Pollicipes pollicipes TaxID=41117 RepID=UPI001884F676|nr:chitinase-3-like protein 1 [Pollicipes pollicipes]